MGSDQGTTSTNPSGNLTSTMLLSADGRSSRVARDEVRRLCSDGRVGADDVDTAVLLTSELVTNAVVHTADPVVLDTALGNGTLHVEVTDRSPRLPKPAAAVASYAQSGRGLLLVVELADRWGYRPSRFTRPGKTVWFELDVAAA